MSVSTPQIALYASAARTATPTAVEFNADGYHGLHLVIDVIAVAATPSVVPTVDFHDALSDKWCNLLTGAALTTTGTVVLKIGPDFPPVANLSASDCIHGRMRLVMTHGDSDSISYSASAHLIG